MKLFISWSGEQSHKIALALRDWLPYVIHFADPYVSSEDIDKGARWSTDIASELEKSNFGILCVTNENFEAPWLNFEAGALSKTIDKSRVAPLLFGLKRSDIKSGPLLQFQSTIAEKDDVRKLLDSINDTTEQRLDVPRLSRIFDKWWPTLEDQFASIDSSSKTSLQPAKTKNDKSSEIFEEILGLLRQQNRLLNSPTDILPPSYLQKLLTDERGYSRQPEIPKDHPVFEHLAFVWNQLEAILEDSDEKVTDIAILLSAIRDLQQPIQFILNKYGDGPQMRKFRRGVSILRQGRVL